jgi:hypothetical protein
MTDDVPERRNSIVGGMLLLFTRGFLLWIVIPVASVLWLVLAIRFRRRGVKYGQYLGWVDMNLIAFLQRGVFRPLVKWPVSFVPPGEMQSVTHRISRNDPL